MTRVLRVLIMVLGLSVASVGESMPVMPNMQMDTAAMERGMKMLAFFNAPIEDTTKLSGEDVERLIKLIEKKDRRYADYSDQIEQGYNKAVEVLKPGVSFDTFVKKAIELSGVKAKLDADAKAFGYDSALDMTLKTTRIMRAGMHIQMEKEIAKAPKEQQAMMRSMMSGIMGSVNNDDIKVVEPYMERLKVVLEQQKQ